MAYTFNAINSALDDGSDKFNMFDQKPGKAKPQFGGSSANGNFQLGSASGGGSISTASQPTGSAPPASSGAKSPASYNPADAQAAFRGIGAVDTTQQRGRISGDIAGANDKLQAEADSYAGKVKDTAAGYGLDGSVLEGAASGNDAAFQTAQARLAKAQNDPFENFKGLEGKEITALQKSTSPLENKETFGEIFRPTASANYGSGESRFQSLLLGMDSGFKSDARKLVRGQEDAVKANDSAVVDKTKDARETLSKAYTDATGKIRSDLGGMSNQVVSEAEKRAVAEAAIRAGLDPSKIGAQEFQKLAESFRKEFTGSQGLLGRSVDYLNDPAAFDLSRYVNVDKDVTADEMMTKEDVDRFNRINGLLGNGNLKTLNPQGAGAQYSFDGQGASSDLKSQLEGRRMVDDQKAQSAIDEIIKGATGRSTADQGNAVQNAKDYVTRRYLDQNEGQSEREQAIEKEAFNQLFREGTNWEPYFKQVGAINADSTPNRTWQDMLTAEEARQLNEHSKSLGVGNTYNQGKSYNAENYNPDYFNTNFEKTFARILGELNGTVPLTSDGSTTVNPLVGGIYDPNYRSGGGAKKKPVQSR